MAAFLALGCSKPSPPQDLPSAKSADPAQAETPKPGGNPVPSVVPEPTKAPEAGAADSPLAPWDKPENCVATFHKPYDVKFLGKTQFTIEKGSRHLISYFFGKATAYVLLLLPEGAQVIEVEAQSLAEAPYSSQCKKGQTVKHVGVFADVKVFKDKQLSDEVCVLKRGTTFAPTDGQAIKWEIVDINTHVYKLSLGSLGARCKNLTTGYIQAPKVDVHGVDTVLFPIQSLSVAK